MISGIGPALSEMRPPGRTGTAPPSPHRAFHSPFFLDRDSSLTQHLCSSPTMYIGTTLQDNRFDILPPFRKRTLPASRVDDGNESDDPFRQPDAGTSPNSFLESIQRHSTGNVEVIPRPSELPTTPVSRSVCPLLRLDLTLACTRFPEIPRILTKHARRSQLWNNRLSRRRGSQGARSSTVIPWGLVQLHFENKSNLSNQL